MFLTSLFSRGKIIFTVLKIVFISCTPFFRLGDKMSLDDFLSKKKKDSKKPTLKDESPEPPSESITKNEFPTTSLSSEYLWSLLVETQQLAFPY